MYTIYTVDYTLNPEAIRPLGPEGTPDSDKALALFSSVMQEHGIKVYICSSTKINSLRYLHPLQGGGSRIFLYYIFCI